MSITAPPDKRTPASLLFAIYTLVIALMGAGLVYLGATRMAAQTALFYPVLGVALAVAGVLLFLKKRAGLWVFALSLLGTWIHEVMAALDATPRLPEQSAGTLPSWLQGVPESMLVPAAVAAMGLIMLAFWPVARKRLVGVAKPGYVIINGVLPLAILATIALTRL